MAMFIIRLERPDDAPRVLVRLRERFPFQSWPTGEFGAPRAALALLKPHDIDYHIAVPPVVQGSRARAGASLDPDDAFAEPAGMSREEFLLLIDLHKRFYDKTGEEP